jgi:hypothetical protein
MSRQTWASVVSKQVNHPVTSTQNPTLVLTESSSPKQAYKHLEAPESPIELLPTEVSVPEPPPSSQLKLSTQDQKAVEFNIYENELRRIQETKVALETDIETKRDKFHSSYAFTRYNQDMEALYKQKTILDEREAKTKLMLLLSSGAHAKRALEVVKRIKCYLGVQEEYLRRYTTFDNEIRIVCNIREGSLLEFFSADETGLEWKITESIDKEYYWPNRVSIQFTVQTSEMVPILEAAIKSELGDFITVNK